MLALASTERGAAAPAPAERIGRSLTGGMSREFTSTP